MVVQQVQEAVAKELLHNKGVTSLKQKQKMSYLDTTHNVYKEAALTPDVGLCCTTNPIWELPGLKIPKNWDRKKENYSFYSYCPDLVEMRELAIKKGGKCLSKYYLNARTLLDFKCSKGHHFKIHANSIRNGNWCSQCGGSHPLNIDIVRTLAAKRGEKCLSDTYINQSEKMIFQCSKGHQYKCTTKNYKKGRGCPDCAKVNRQNNRRLGIEKMQEIALSFGGKCLSETYINNRTKLRWQCKKGHIWSAVYGNVIEKGSWCPRCRN